MTQAETFDYVIIGAGSAGCVLANRLSADPDIRVCLIEAGGTDNSLLVRMPAGAINLIRKKNAYNWGFWTVPQKHMNDRRLWWPRGRGWGGSSSINGMIYIRGHARDYDSWRQAGLEGWGFEDVLPYFRKAMNYTGASSESRFHGHDGPLVVDDSPLDSPVYGKFLQAGREAGYPHTDDFNGVQQEGFGGYQRTICNGQRWNTSRAYLRPVVNERPNLVVKSGALVSRIVFEGKRACGAEIVSGRRKKGRIIRADRETILCAGAVQSPQILMLSGIGPADAIRSHGIDCLVDSPGVGANLQDHLDITIIHEMTDKSSAWSKQAGLKKIAVGLQYLRSQSGPGADNFLQAGAFLKTRDSLECPDIQLHLVNVMMHNHGRHQYKRDGFTVHACQLRPESRGHIRLASSDPFAMPLIDPDYLATQTDRETLRKSVVMVRDICRQTAFDDLRGREVLPGDNVQTDEQIDTFIREAGETIYHPVGSVAMGAHDTAPLDNMLKVRGTDGLRVVDASVMPQLVSGNTNAPTIMIAEKAADLVLGRSALASPEK